jgi:shikimate 5-dehydrogenase
MIDSNTLLFGSFAREAGNIGCRLFNTAFKYYGINAIYKSFSVDNMKDAVEAALTLDMKGFAVTMPFKKEILNYVDEKDDYVEKIAAANTIINKDGKLLAYNTDFLAAREFMCSSSFQRLHVLGSERLYILGAGGYAEAVKSAAKEAGFRFINITRENWDILSTLMGCLIYNCTPLVNIVHTSNKYIDCLTDTKTGRKLALMQASYQFGLYTSKEFPFNTGERWEDIIK